MGVYSGNTNAIFDIIARTLTDENIISYIETEFHTEIGEIRMISNTTAPVNLSTNTYALNLSEAMRYYSDGWIYPTGSDISDEAFPSAYSVFRNAGFPTSVKNGYNCVKIPYVSGFFKSCGSRVQFQQNSQIFQMPRHNHDFNFSGGASAKQIIKNATYVYETAGPTSDTSDQSAPDGHYTLHAGKTGTLESYDIPVYPNAASNETASVDMKNSDSNLNKMVIYPKNFIISVMIYVGRPGK